ncbi:GIY-YIG nuclease family protein [Candidatus Peregrinibacteria bacterium]|nr:GIY-YIG nuclease family protein [Candidatus Peregrinibacteria bacterium]
MNSYWVYILECSDKSFYTGVCNNIERRYAEHEAGENESCYTSSRLPVKVVYCEEIEREKQIKGWSRAKKEALILEDWTKLVRLSMNYTKYPATLRPFGKFTAGGAQGDITRS